MIGCLDPLPIPRHLQLTILEKTLITRSCHTLYSFLKLYIYRYGIDNGPLTSLPFHPVYPFLTLLKFNHRFEFRLPQEAYHLLWYLSDLYTIGIVFDKLRLLPYLAQCEFNVHRLSQTDYRLCKWLLNFGPISFWQDQIRQCPWQFPVVLFSAKLRVMSTTLPTQDCVALRDFQTSIMCGHNRLQCFDDPPTFNNLRVQMCLANGIDPSEVPVTLLHQDTAYWKNLNVYPPDFVESIRELLFGHMEQYASMSLQDEDHPVYRVEL